MIAKWMKQLLSMVVCSTLLVAGAPAEALQEQPASPPVPAAQRIRRVSHRQRRQSRCRLLSSWMRWSRQSLFILMRWWRRFVDDNTGVRRLLRRELLDSAIAIWECADGADALAAYADRQPDIVLMDVRMPRMDGLAATRQIREFHPGARVVIVTDYDDEDLRKAALEAGARGYVLKQNLTDISRLIRVIIGK